MRVFACITTFNADDVIDGALEALLHQTRKLDAILIVDNASTDGTLNRTFPEQVRIIRNASNIGPSGAIPIGFRYALEHGFDWMWILDHDSAPEPDALETLLETLCRLATRPTRRDGVHFLPTREPGRDAARPAVHTPRPLSYYS